MCLNHREFELRSPSIFLNHQQLNEKLTRISEDLKGGSSNAVGMLLYLMHTNEGVPPGLSCPSSDICLNYWESIIYHN